MSVLGDIGGFFGDMLAGHNSVVNDTVVTTSTPMFSTQSIIIMAVIALVAIVIVAKYSK